MSSSPLNVAQSSDCQDSFIAGKLWVLAKGQVQRQHYRSFILATQHCRKLTGSTDCTQTCVWTLALGRGLASQQERSQSGLPRHHPRGTLPLVLQHFTSLGRLYGAQTLDLALKGL